MKAFITLLKSFGYAFNGIWLCIKNCRNFRIHMIAVLYVMYFSRFYDFDVAIYGILFLTFAMVLTAECINSSLEYTCNSVTDKYNENIKKAKDTAAGAVLICAIFAIFIALLFFSRIDIILQIIDYFASPLKLLIFALSIIISLIFIFYKDVFKNGK